MLLKKWPLLQQIRGKSRGTSREVMSSRTKQLAPKTESAQVTRSICPYCGVGCGQLIFHKQGKLISIEGDPESPISRGRLCPKGADTHELHTHSSRLTKVKYRGPFKNEWSEIDLETAMNMVADRPRELRIKSTMDATGVLISVEDTGLGLGGEEDLIFHPFYTTKPEGIGMGLSISRSIIEAHGGRLWAAARVPHGAVFQFNLPKPAGAE